MGARWGRGIVTAVSLTLVCLCGLGTARQTQITRSMGNSDYCLNNAHTKKVLWISEDTSAIVSGKSGRSSTLRRAENCQFIFGLASKKKDARLVLRFNFIFIHDCGVKLQVNESQTDNFELSRTNHQIYMSECNMVSPQYVYARPKHYILIRLIREDSLRLNYNFHLNVSMTESLPSTGPALHVVIIVGFVLGVVVLTATCLLLKYVMRLSYRYREQRSEEAMTRAISLYNSQDHSSGREPDMVYIEPGTVIGQGDRQRSTPGIHHSSGPEIAFVHSDGRIERFRTTDRASSNHSVPPASHSPRSNGVTRKHVGNKPRRGVGSSSVGPKVHSKVAVDSSSPQDGAASPLLQVRTTAATRRSTGDVSEIGLDSVFDVPPSYEEALGMPGPGELGRSLDGEEEGVYLSELEGTTDGDSVRGCLTIDYMNVGSDSNLDQGPAGMATEGESPTADDSGHVLPSTEDS